MNNRPSGCLTIILVLFLGIPLFFLMLFFGIDLISKKPLFGFLYFATLVFLADRWSKRQKAKQEATKNMLNQLQYVAVEEKKLKQKARIKEKKLEKKEEIWLIKAFNERLKKDKKPNKVTSYRGCQIKIYYLAKNKRAYKIVNWDNRTIPYVYKNIKEARSAIYHLYPPGISKLEYLAEKEKKLRKQEEMHYLAKAYRQRKKRSRIKTNLTTIDGLLELTPIEFEKWVKENVFEKDGWEVEETRVTGDGGIDLVLRKDGEHSIAQCKRFRKTVGEPALRDFYGTMMSEGVSRGYFVTTGLFSLSAQKFADEKPIILIDRRVLADKLTK